LNIIPLQCNILLDGYFQFDKHFIENKDYIDSILNINNIERINNTYTISNIMRIVNSYKENGENEITMHIRLDDFINNNACMHYEEYYSIINMFPDNIKNVRIITDTIKQTWESEYIVLLYRYLTNKNYKVIIESGDTLLNDFAKMYHSPFFCSSNSTFSYIAGLLGKHKQSWCPSNVKVWNQKIFKFDDNTTNIIIDKYL
jgi:hypothetical protein